MDIAKETQMARQKDIVPGAAASVATKSNRVIRTKNVAESTLDGNSVLSVADSVGSDSKESNGSGKNRSYAIVEVGDKEQGNGEELGCNDHEFRVGDFVWGKIKSYPWWPGQIYDAKDASEFAVRHSQENRILVAFFGDGSCAWCLPSQLAPFSENFEQMSRDGSSNNFFNAIQKATDGIGRVVEANMTCKCIPLDKRGDLARQVVSHSGVKPGVLVPEVDIQRLSIPEYGSAEILVKVSNFAKGVCFDSVFEIAVLRSWLSAFYYSKGGHRLPVCCDQPVYVEGLEDKDKNVAAVSDDFSVPIKVPILRPLEDDWLSSSAVNAAKSQPSSVKVYYRRKQKSFLDLMAENNNVLPKIRRRDTIKEGKEIGKSASLKKMKRNDEEVVKVGSSIGKRATKRKVRVSEPEISNDKIPYAEDSGTRAVVDGVNVGALVEKTDEIKVAFAEDTSDGNKEESENVSTLGGRKRSKYLFSPCANHPLKMENSSSMNELESDVAKLTDEASYEKNLVNVEVEGRDAVKHGNKLTFPTSNVDVPVDELLSGIRFAAVDRLYLSKKGSPDMVCSFASAFRSSTYSRGSDYKVYRKFKTVTKVKSSSQLGNQENDSHKKKPKSSHRKPHKASKSKKAAESSRARTSAEGNVSLSLILTFEPGFPLPTKDEIEGLFGKFGKLNENETVVVSDSHSVWIVYMNGSDAEVAFKSCVRESPFGVENVNYWLQHSSGGTKSRPKFYLRPPKKADDFMSVVEEIKQKLEIMTAIMQNYHSKFSPEDKTSLKEEMKHLTENVEAACKKVHVMAENASLRKES